MMQKGRLGEGVCEEKECGLLLCIASFNSGVWMVDNGDYSFIVTSLAPPESVGRGDAEPHPKHKKRKLLIKHINGHTLSSLRPITVFFCIGNAIWFLSSAYDWITQTSRLGYYLLYTYSNLSKRFFYFIENVIISIFSICHFITISSK